ncbi:uncharacterized protein LOC133515817 [Cydia pomonella]|uniref:uncharacterized protein LOC133515817 n=1 Tax=Cydia pomonella TaxID=82600 RepID=UPI002ADE7CA8|nr:uncharacterized protein LOC133515817 [Cydia pomonella]
MKCVRFDMLHFKIFLLFMIPLTVQSYNRRAPPEKKITKPFSMPDNINIDLANQLKVPNKAFCEKMALSDADFFMVMPWWYHYCEGLKEKEEKNTNQKVRFLRPYQKVLHEVQDYKRKQRIWNEVASILRPARL